MGYPRSGKSLVLVSAGKPRIDPFVGDLDRHALQSEAKAGTPDAFAGRRLEHSAVRGTHEITVIRAKKLVIDPVQRDPGMRTAIDVGEVIAFIVDQQSLKVALATAQSEFLALAVLQLPHGADPFAHGFLLSCTHRYSLHSASGFRSP